jgi:hypothetical protein
MADLPAALRRYPYANVLSVRIPIEGGNAAFSDHDFGTQIRNLPRAITARTAHFPAMNGLRCGSHIVGPPGPSPSPTVAAPCVFGLKPDATVQPVRRFEDLLQSGLPRRHP